MFNFEVCFLREAHDILELKSPQTTKPPILFGCVALEMYTRIIKHCSQLHSADCLFIRMCTGRLAVPVVVWVACGTHFFININALVLWIQNVQNADRKTLSSMENAMNVLVAITSGRPIIANLKKSKLYWVIPTKRGLYFAFFCPKNLQNPNGVVNLL